MKHFGQAFFDRGSDSRKGTLKEPARSFLMEEFKALRVEIEARAKTINQSILFAATGNAAVLSWAYSNHESCCRLVPDHRAMLALAPIIFTLIFFVRDRIEHRAIARIGWYLSKVEKSMRLPPGLGWETSCRGEGSKPQSSLWKSLFSRWRETADESAEHCDAQTRKAESDPNRIHDRDSVLLHHLYWGALAVGGIWFAISIRVWEFVLGHGVLITCPMTCP